MASPHLGFGASLVENAQIIGALVRAGESFKTILRFLATVGRGSGELISDGQAEKAQGLLVLGIDGQNVTTDGLGLFRLVEIAVVLGFRQGLGDAALRDGLQLAFHTVVLILIALF